MGAAYAAGSVVVRDEEWIVSSCEPAGEGWKVRCVGSSERVASVPATFFSELDEITALDPADAELVQDDSPYFRRSRLWVEVVEAAEFLQPRRDGGGEQGRPLLEPVVGRLGQCRSVTRWGAPNLSRVQLGVHSTMGHNGEGSGGRRQGAVGR